MTLLCHANRGTQGTGVPHVKSYWDDGSPGATNNSSLVMAADPLSTEPNFHWGGNRLHYATNWETATNGIGLQSSVTTDDFNHNRLPMMSGRTSASWASVAAALPGSALYTNIFNRGVEIANWQAAHRGLGKWGCTFSWAYGHENNGSSLEGGSVTAGGPVWLAAMKVIIECWKTVPGLTFWDGENDFTTYQEGLIPGVCLIGDHPAFQAINDIKSFWPDSGTNSAWANQNLAFFAPDVYNGSTLLRYWPPETIMDRMRLQMQAKAASQAALHNDNFNRTGRPYLQFIYEHACAELDHFTASGQPNGAPTGAGGTVAGMGPGWTTRYPGIPYTKAFWQQEAANYFATQWPDLAALVYWEDNAQAGPSGPGATNFLDSSQAAWDSFITNWVDNPTFENASDPVPTGTPTSSAPDVSQPTVLQSTAIINSGTAGTQFTSASFNVGPDELVLLWTQAESSSVVPGVPTMSFPTAPTQGTAPTFTRIAAGDHAWSTVAAGGINAAQGLWVASTASSGAARGCVLRVTFPASLGGCTVIMERIVGADLAGAVAAAIVGAPVKNIVASGTTNGTTLPAPADTRNRSFVLSSHRQNEPTTPGSSGAKVATLIGSGGSMTPVVGNVHLAVVYMADGSGVAPLVTSITGNNLTWTKYQELTDTGNQGTVSVWQGFGASPTTGTPVITTNIGGGISFLRAHFIDISNATGLGSVATGIIPAGQGTTGQSSPMTYQQTTSGLFTAALLAQNASATMTPSGTQVAGTGGAQGVTDEFSRFEIWRSTFDDARPTNPGYAWSEAHYFFAALYIEVTGGGASAALAEGTDATRTAPAAIGVATAHSVGSFQQIVAESWATASRGALMAVEVATGPPASGVRLGSTSQYLSTFETMLGRGVDSERVSVADSAALVTMGTGGWLTASQGDAGGRAIFISCFLGTNTWAQVAAGNANTFIDSIGAYLAAFTQLGVFAYFPEPEDDTGTRGTSAQFRAASTFVINRLRPLMPGWRFANVLNEADWFSTSAFVGTPYFSANGRLAQDWIVPEADILAVNAFNTKGAFVTTHPYADPSLATYTDIPIVTWASGWLASAAANAKYLMLSEFGCAVDNPSVNPNGHTARAAWIGSAMAYLKGRAEAVHYADLDSADGRINLRISGGVKTAEQDSVDAFASGAGAVSLTKTHTTSAIIRKAATKTHTATAIVRKTLTRTQTADAVVNSPLAKTQTVDAIITKSGVTRTHTSDAYITPYVLVSHVTSSSSASVSSVTVS